MKQQSRQYSAPALEKGLDIIEALYAADEPLTTKAIGQRLHLSKSQIFRNLKVLEDRHYIERDQMDRFGPTNKLFELGMRRPPVASLLETAYPVMVETAGIINQSCHISVASRDQMVVVARVESPGEIGYSLRIGYRVNMADSASGRVLLAFQDDRQRDRQLEQIRRSPPHGFDEPRLLRALTRIRARGYEQAQSPIVVGMTDVSVPLFDGDGSPVACLAAPFVNRRAEPNDIGQSIDVLRRAGAEISAGLAAAAGRQPLRSGG